MTVIPALALPSSPTSSVLPSFSRSPHSHTIPPPNPSNSSSKLSSPPSPPSPSTEEPLVHIQNCRIASDSGVSQPSSIWFDPVSGKIVGAQEAFYAAQERGREVREVDMGGDVVAPGYLDIQINGAYGFDFSTLPDLSKEFPTPEAQDVEYVRRLEYVASRLVETGVTSFVPTIITQTPALYQRLLPLLKHYRFPTGASSLGFHAEGPFLSPHKPGCHPQANLLSCEGGWDTFEKVYGRGFMDEDKERLRMFTVAPEVKGVLRAVEEVKRRGGLVCVGHSDATGVEAMAAVLAGATMITHLYNAMPQLHHRDTGIIGLIGSPTYIPPSLSKSVRKLLPDPISKLISRPASPKNLSSSLAPLKTSSPPSSVIVNDTQESSLSSAQSSESDEEEEEEVVEEVVVVGDQVMGSQVGPKFQRPFWGIIVDGIHVHPNAVRLAYQAFPEGCVLVTDCVFVMDPSAKDGLYSFRPPQQILRQGLSITLEGTSTLAGSAVDMTTCVRNLSAFASIPLWKAIVCCTNNAARALGKEWEGRKGRLEKGWDGDMVVLDAEGRVKATWVGGREVWKRNKI